MKATSSKDTSKKVSQLLAAGGGNDEEEAAVVMGLREEVLREAKKRGTPEDVEGLALKLLSQQQRQAYELRQEKVSLLAQLERSRRETADLQGQLAAAGPEATAQAVLDSRILSARLSLRDVEQARAVVDLIRQIHSFGTTSSHVGGGGATATAAAVALEHVQASEGKRNLNRALRCLVMENHCRVNSCIAEVVKFTDRQHVQQQHDAAAAEPPNIQMVFIEGESLIFRIMDMRLQPRDIHMLCSLDEAWPRAGGGWGLKALFAVTDTPVLFSTPFQIRLDAAARGPQGMLCPEWVPSVDATTPRGEAVIPPAYRARIKDNCTFVYAPLRASVKELLRSADMEPFDGLALAFLDRVRKLDLMLVSYEGPAEVKVVRNVQHEVELSPVRLLADGGDGEGGSQKSVRALKDSVRVAGHRVAECLVRCTKITRIPDRNYQDEGQGPEERRYRLHEFQVGVDGVAGSSDRTTTRLTLAFPLGPDRQPVPKEQWRKEHDGCLHSESLYSQMPVPFAGKLPFAFQADFDLTSDMMGLHPTSAWNHWLLSCMARLFVLAFVADPALRNHVDRYVPVAEEMPAGGLWHGVRDMVVKLLESHMFVKTESGHMVARVQAVVRPACLAQDFVSDALLQEVTKGRHHFAADGVGPGPACPLGAVLKCVDKLVAQGNFSEAHLGSLWTFLADRVTSAGDGNAEELAPSLTLLQEKLGIFPVEGVAELQRFKQPHGGVPLVLSVSSEVEALLRAHNPQLRASLLRVVDLDRMLRGGAPRPLVEQALQAVGAKPATVESIQPVIRRLLQQEGTSASPHGGLDPDRFWALRSLVVDGLGVGSLREFLGGKAPLSVPVLELRPGGGVGPRLARVEAHEDVSERFVLPSFLGVKLGQPDKASAALLQAAAASGDDGVPKGRAARGVVLPPTSLQTWDALVQWEGTVAQELGIDGGSNRNWQGLFEEVLPPAQLAEGVMKGLKDPSTTAEGRRAFAKLLESYLEQHAQVFEQLRSANRLSTPQLLQLVQNPKFAETPQGHSSRFSQSFVEACLGLLGKDKGVAAALTMEEIKQVLPVAETEEWPEARQFQEVAQLAVMDVDSLHAVALAMLVVTRRLGEQGVLLPSSAAGGTGNGTVATATTLQDGNAKWGHFLHTLFRKAIENLSRAYGLAIRNRKRKRPGGNNKGQEDDVSLFEAYCRQYGLWLVSGDAPTCYPLAQVVWSLDDPITHFVTAALASQGGGNKAVAPAVAEATCVALDKEVNGLLETEEEEEGTSDMVRRFFTDSLGVTGDKYRGQFLDLLRQGLERWAQNPGPMPRDVEDQYRTLATTVLGGASAAPTGGSPAVAKGASFPEIPVLNLNFAAGTLAMLSPAAAAAAAASTQTQSLGLAKGSKGGVQPLVGVAGPGDSDDGALDWFYREFFPSRCVHPAIFSLFKLSSPALLPRLVLANPRQSFMESYADTTGSMVSALKAMNVDAVNVIKVLGELYGQPTLRATELPRYWANVTEVRDMVLAELWKTEGEARNEELIEAAKASLKLPMCAKGTGVWGAEATVPLVNVQASAEAKEPVSLGSILGIDLELQDKHLETLPRIVKHPTASRESAWHRANRAEDGFQQVEQACYWERFLLELGVQCLTKEHMPLISSSVFQKLFLGLAKFNGLLNSPEQTIASKYTIWHTYHYLYRVLDGNMYLTCYKELRAAAAAKSGGAANAGGAVAAAAAAATLSAPQPPQGTATAYPYHYPGAAPSAAYPTGTTGLPPATPYLPPPMQAGYAFPPAYATAPQPPPPPPEVHGGQPPPPAKRQRTQMSAPTGADNNGGASGAEGEAATKAPRLVPPVPPAAPSPVQQEEGEVEEGEIED